MGLFSLGMETISDATLLLVHGAWGGAWCWRDFVKLLDQHGVASLAIELPSSRLGAAAETALGDDAAALYEAARRIDGPLVLVAHSYGGAVITEVAPRITQLERLVYVAALIPATGQSATDASREVRKRTLLDEAMRVDGSVLRLDPELAHRALYGECDPETARWAIDQLSVQAIASFRAPRTSLDVEAPSSYIICTNDQAVDPELQLVMARRCDEYSSISSDHSPFLSHPEVLFDAILGQAIGGHEPNC